METKTVNAWFQNKRASSKKRTRGVSYDTSPISPLSASTDPPPTSHKTNPYRPVFDDFHDDEYSPIDIYHSRPTSTAPPDHSHPLASFYAGNPDHSHFLSETESMPRRMRVRPTAEQTDELKKLYNINPHPTTDQRQLLAERIGMRYQSITNWFQNQRSLAKKRRDDVDVLFTPASEHHGESRTYSGFPPPSNQPSLSLTQTNGHYSAPGSGEYRSPSISPSMDDLPHRSSRRSSTPYSTSASSFSRTRRSRPEPYQLDALKDLYTKTQAPSIEERTALALEIGMDVGKVTNWFRNLRQTARKRVKRPGSGDDDDYDSVHNTYSTSVSRAGTPSLRSSSSSSSMELDGYDYDMQGINSDIGSEDEYQEPVTPPPELTPAPSSTSASSSRITISQLTLSNEPASYAELEKISTAQYSPGIKIEDALLLLSFHHHIVH